MQTGNKFHSLSLANQHPARKSSMDGPLDPPYGWPLGPALDRMDGPLDPPWTRLAPWTRLLGPALDPLDPLDPLDLSP